VEILSRMRGATVKKFKVGDIAITKNSTFCCYSSFKAGIKVKVVHCGSGYYCVVDRNGQWAAHCDKCLKKVKNGKTH
jgi:hypothetical protein